MLSERESYQSSSKKKKKEKYRKVVIWLDKKIKHILKPAFYKLKGKSHIFSLFVTRMTNFFSVLTVLMKRSLKDISWSIWKRKRFQFHLLSSWVIEKQELSFRTASDSATGMEGCCLIWHLNASCSLTQSFKNKEIVKPHSQEFDS